MARPGTRGACACSPLPGRPWRRRRSASAMAMSSCAFSTTTAVSTSVPDSDKHTCNSTSCQLAPVWLRARSNRGSVIDANSPLTADSDASPLARLVAAGPRGHAELAAIEAAQLLPVWCSAPPRSSPEPHCNGLFQVADGGAHGWHGTPPRVFLSGECGAAPRRRRRGPGQARVTVGNTRASGQNHMPWPRPPLCVKTKSNLDRSKKESFEI